MKNMPFLDAVHRRSLTSST